MDIMCENNIINVQKKTQNKTKKGVLVGCSRLDLCVQLDFSSGELKKPSG